MTTTKKFKPHPMPDKETRGRIKHQTHQLTWKLREAWQEFDKGWFEEADEPPGWMEGWHVERGKLLGDELDAVLRNADAYWAVLGDERLIHRLVESRCALLLRDAMADSCIRCHEDVRNGRLDPEWAVGIREDVSADAWKATRMAAAAFLTGEDEAA